MDRQRTAKQLAGDGKRSATCAKNRTEREAREAAWKAEKEASLAKGNAESEAEEAGRESRRKAKIASSKAAAEARKDHKKLIRGSFRLTIEEGIELALGASASPMVIDDMSPAALEDLETSANPIVIDDTAVLDEFTLFPELPVELRLKIVSLICVISEFNFQASQKYAKANTLQFRHMFPEGRRVPLWMQSIIGQVAPPVTLHINVESRLETLRYYQVLWPSNSPGFKTGYSIIDRPLIVNPERDTLVLKPTSRLLFFSRGSTSYDGPRL